MAEFIHKQALPPDFRLGSYKIVHILGVGGFGVTYLGEHLTLGHQVAVKEYLPNEFAVRDGATVQPKSVTDQNAFDWGRARFLDEARMLTRFRHPNIVRASDYFEANNTAYIVMDYEDGQPLDVLLEQHGTLTETQLRRVVLPVADGLRQVHAAGCLHRDIKPANIFVRRADESPVLLDFGAARQALSSRSKSMTTIASAGYSPPEQYENDGNHGPWTDIYALSALCRRAITGETPLEATTRLNRMLRTKSDPLPDLAGAGAPSYSRPLLTAVDKGLRLIEQERPQHIDDWIALAKGKPNDKKQKVSKDTSTARPTADKRRRDGFLWKLARGEFGLAKTYWLYDTVVFLVAACAWVWLGFVFGQNAEWDQAAVRNWGFAYLLAKIVASAFVIAHLPYGIFAMVGVWRSAGAYAGLKLWSVLARAHVVIQVVFTPLGWTNQWFAWTFGNALGTGMFILGPLVLIWTVRKLLRRLRSQTASNPVPDDHAPVASGVKVRRWAAGAVVVSVLLGFLAFYASLNQYAPRTDDDEAPRRTDTIDRNVERPASVAPQALVTAPFTVVALPAGASVRIMDVDGVYRDGTALPPGQYRVLVSAPGHEAKTVEVAHGSEPTRISVELEPIAAPASDQMEVGGQRTEVAQRELSVQELAERGDADAQFKLGGMYLLGNGRSKNEAQGVRWTMRSAEQGHVQAGYTLGLMYATGGPNGTAVDKDMGEAAKWLRKAAERGHADAQYRLGLHYEDGEGVTQDHGQAAYWYEKSAEQGDAQAQFNLALLYDDGEGVAKDAREAAHWYRKSAEQGNVKAQFNLALKYDKGEGVIRDGSQAARWYGKAAEQGDADAQFNLALMYAKGEGVEKDNRQAIYWYRKSADQGDSSAQVNLGLAYFNGIGTQQNQGEAVLWFQKAAEQDNDIAQYNLGVAYNNGMGVSKNYREAMGWYLKAAGQGHADAQNNLGVMYSDGMGVSVDYVRAYAWFLLASTQGLEMAAQNQNNLRPRMTATQVADAEAMRRRLVQ